MRKAKPSTWDEFKALYSDRRARGLLGFTAIREDPECFGYVITFAEDEYTMLLSYDEVIKNMPQDSPYVERWHPCQ